VELLAFASFAALVLAWIVAPNTTEAPLSEATVEAHAEAA
jgi:hypothetical protein